MASIIISNCSLSLLETLNIYLFLKALANRDWKGYRLPFLRLMQIRTLFRKIEVCGLVDASLKE